MEATIWGLGYYIGVIWVILIISSKASRVLLIPFLLGREEKGFVVWDAKRT